MNDNKEIEELDRELDIELILQWRYLFYLKIGWQRFNKFVLLPDIL